MTRIVIIDDSRDVCNIYTDTLRCAGYNVECINNGEVAVKKICKEQPDLVLLDVLMPKINGLHLLDLILKDPSHTKTRVVMLTNISDSAIQEKALRSGATDYIVKSETPISELLQRIDKALS